MNIGAVMCSLLGGLFLLMGALFAALKEKAAMLISGFNTLPPEKRALYDTARMSRDQRNSFLLWAAVLAAGAALSLLVSQYCAIAAFAVWLILFFREVHFDVEKAFEKYRRK